MSHSIFKAGILLLLFALTACDDIPRDNILDPKNPESYRAQVLLVDAFVNTNNDQQFNEWMLTALESLKSQFGSRLVIAEHHRNSTAFNDSLHLDASEVLYSTLVGINGGSKGVPDVFINNSDAQIKGASSVSTALLRLQTAVQPLISNISEFTLEPEVSRAGNTVTVSVNVAKLGNSAADDFKLRMMVLENTNITLQKRIVRKIDYSNVIRNLDHGELSTVSFDPFQVEWSGKLRILVAVSSIDERKIYQSIVEDVP